MTEPAKLLQQLLAAENEERETLLRAHHPLETAFFRALREHVRETVKVDAHEALRVTDVGLEAVAFAADQEGVAQAWWARGNTLLFLLRHDDCLAAYSAAISIFASLSKAEEIAQLQSNCIPPLMWTGRYAEAQAMGQSALAVLERQGETRPVANLALNLGLCAIHRGGHSEALIQTERAAAIFSRLGDAVETARCRVTQAWALERLERFAESEARLQEALRVFADHRVWIDQGRAALNLGVLHARLAEHQIALRWFEESRQGFLKAGVEMEAAVVDLYRAQSLLDLNLLPEAAALSAELEETFTRLKMPRQVARAALLLAEVHTRRGQPDLAHAQLARARQVFCAERDAAEVAQIDLRRAAALLATGRPGQALRLAAEAVKTLDVRHYPLRHAEAHLLVAACCERLGQVEEVQVAYRTAWAAGAQPTGATEPPPFLAYRIAHARGILAEAAGDLPLARGEYGRAVGYLTRVAQDLGLDELRGGYLADKRAVYESALRLALDEGRLADAFRTCELARAGALRDFLAGGRPRRPNGPDAALANLKARWAWQVSQVQRPLDWLAEAKQEQAAPEERQARLRELADLERGLQDAYRCQRLNVPDLAALERGEVIGLDELPRYLPENTALLYFDCLGERLLAFVMVGGTTRVVELGALDALRWEASALGHALEEVRLFGDPADLAMLEDDLLRQLQVLYRAVLTQPLEQVGPDVRRLLIVPCDVLHTLPLEALHDGKRHLVERYAVCYLPAASVLPALPGGRDAGAGRALVLAHSWDGRLPLTLLEAQQVAVTLARDATRPPLLLTEEQATAQALRAQAGVAGVVHIAAHGTFRADAPLFSALHLADGPLTVHDIYDLDLGRVALAALSGCQTGLGQSRGGEVLGLAHALFFAGAPALVVSRWRVDDEVTASLMQDLYTILARGETVAEALQAAQLSALTRHPHAGYWAAFAVWGRGFDTIFRAGDGGKTEAGAV